MKNFLKYSDNKLFVIKKIYKINEDFVGKERIYNSEEDNHDYISIYKNPITEREILELIQESKYKDGLRIGVVSEKEIYFYPKNCLPSDIEAVLNKKFILNLSYSKDEKEIYDSDVANENENDDITQAKMGTFTDKKRELILAMDKYVAKIKQKVPVVKISRYEPRYKEVQAGLLDVFPLGTKFANYIRIPIPIEKQQDLAILQKQEYNWYLDKKIFFG